MRLILTRVTVAIGVLLFVSLGCKPSQEDAPIMDKDVRYTKYEEVRYPPLARQTAIQGVVVVRVTLDTNGKAMQGTALSGQELLIQSALENAKKWEFKPNSRNTVVLVYNFRIATGFCHSSSSVFVPPNFVTVTACSDIATIY
jgi:TonB family protein